MKSEQHTTDWNKDGVWKKVEDRLHRKHKRRLLYWWSMGAVSFFIFIAMFIWFNKVELIDSQLNKNTIRKSEQKIHAEEFQNTLLLNKTIALDKNTKKEIKPSNAPISQNPAQNKSLPKNKINSINGKIQSFGKNKSEDRFRGNADLVSVPEIISIHKKATKSIIQKRDTLLNTAHSLANKLLEINYKRNDSIKIENASLLPPMNNSTKNLATIGWVESGLSFRLKQKDEGSATGQFRFIHSSAFGIQKFLNKNWSLKFGLSYQTVYKKYDVLKSYTEKEEVFSDEAIVYELPNGVRYVEAGLATLSTNKTRHIIHNNFIHRFSIPIELAYIYHKEKWSLEPSLGFRIQYFQHFNGVILRSGAHYFDQKEINDQYFPNNLGLGLITSLNLKYKLFPKGVLGLKFSYEKDDFLNLYKGDYKTSYETIGMQLGYYYTFE